eukprot:EG_transcript_23087
MGGCVSHGRVTDFSTLRCPGPEAQDAPQDASTEPTQMPPNKPKRPEMAVVVATMEKTPVPGAVVAATPKKFPYPKPMLCLRLPSLKHIATVMSQGTSLKTGQTGLSTTEGSIYQWGCRRVAVTPDAAAQSQRRRLSVPRRHSGSSRSSSPTGSVYSYCVDPLRRPSMADTCRGPPSPNGELLQDAGSTFFAPSILSPAETTKGGRGHRYPTSPGRQAGAGHNERHPSPALLSPQQNITRCPAVVENR